MFFESYVIFIYIFCFVLVYNISKIFTSHSFVRNFIIFGGNLFVLLLLVKEHTLIVLAILSLLIYGIGKLLQKTKKGVLLGISLVFIITIFSIRNYEVVQDLLNKSFLSILNPPILSVQKIGLSYILFRYIHWLVESYKNKIPESNFFTFLNYIVFFPTILAGPIDTYSNFHYWIKNKRINYHKSLFFAGITRILIGSFKTIAITPLIINFATDYTLLLPSHSPLVAILLSLLAYSFYIYIDFSGYSDIAIGTAYLVGVKTPENFNNPYFSPSLSEFWKRWHITFSNFLKLYVFKPLINFFNKIFNPKYRLFISILSYILTFAICGVWHGDKVNFLYWGIWHGVGLSINKIWDIKIKTKSDFYKSRFYYFLSGMTTFSFVTVGWMFFHYTHEELIEIFNLIKP